MAFLSARTRRIPSLAQRCESARPIPLAAPVMTATLPGTATSTQERAKKTKLGYATFFCPKCQHVFNERTGTPFNYLEFPTDVVLLAVLWRLRYKLSLRDVAEMFLARGFTFTHEAIRDWEARFTPLITDQLRSKRHGQAGKFWYVDETYLKVYGK